MSLTADLIVEPECAALFEPAAFVQALLDVEAALALARAEVGLPSLASAREVEAACRVGHFDVPALVEAGRRGGTIVAPLVAALAAQAQVAPWCAQLGPGVHLRELAGPEFTAVFDAPLDQAAADSLLADWRQRLPHLQTQPTPHAPTA